VILTVEKVIYDQSEHKA